MKPAPFEYVRCETIDEAAALVVEYGDEARVIAGGQSLVAMLNMRLAKPSILVDMMCASGSGEVKTGQGAITVGAGVRQAELLAHSGVLSD